MKESYYQWKKIFISLYHDIIKTTLIMFLIGSFIVLLINVWRFNPLAYILCFLICFGINFFRYFRKKEVMDEFKENQ